MENCIFCKIIAGNIATKFVYEDEEMVVFNDIHPKASTHLLVVPKIHLPSLAEATAVHQDLLARVLLTLPKIAKNAGLKSGFRIILNTGSGGGQEVMHIHFHILGGSKLPGF